MDSKSWIEKKERLEEQYGFRYRHIIEGIKRGLVRNRLASIQRAVRHFHVQPDKAPVVVAHLNNSIGYGSLSFRWFPRYGKHSGKLLIRNDSLGLIVKTDPPYTAQGMKIVVDMKSPESTVAPELALSVLSTQIENSDYSPHHEANLQVVRDIVEELT